MSSKVSDTAIFEFAEKHFGRQSIKAVLNVGCGSTRKASCAILKEIPHAAITGIDKELDEEGQLNCSNGFVTLKRMDILNPAGLGQFDLVYCKFLFSMLTKDSSRRAIEKISNLLKPKGWLVVTDFIYAIPKFPNPSLNPSINRSKTIDIKNQILNRSELRKMKIEVLDEVSIGERTECLLFWNSPPFLIKDYFDQCRELRRERLESEQMIESYFTIIGKLLHGP